MRKHVLLENGNSMTLVSRRGGPLEYNDDELNNFYERWMENEILIYSQAKKVKQVLESDLALIDEYLKNEADLIERLKAKELDQIQKLLRKKSDEMDKEFELEIAPLKKKLNLLLHKFRKENDEENEFVHEYEELDSNIRYGLRVQLNNVEDIRTSKGVQINMEFLIGGKVAIDDFGNFTRYQGSIIDDFLDLTDVRYTLIKTESDKFDIEIGEEFFVLKDIPKLLKRRTNRKPVFIRISIYEVLSEPKFKISKPGVRFLESYLLEQNVRLLGEIVFEIVYFETDINVGRYKNVLMKDIEMLPIGAFQGTSPLLSKLDFNIELFKYDKDTAAGHVMRYRRRRRRRINDDFEIDKRPFIRNVKPQFRNNLFEKGSGIDLYIDGARYLPNSVGVTKILIRVIDSNLKDVMLPQTKLATMDSSIYVPLFEFRHELRLPFYDPTLMVMITLLTLEPDNSTKIFGFSFLPLFINKDTYKPVENVHEESFILLSGNYQIPIYCQEYYQKKPFIFREQ
jgi:hypothetical protein